MTARNTGNPGDHSWSVEDIPYRLLVARPACEDQQLFYLVTSASFIEITSGIYTDNLVKYFSEDDEVVRWLRCEWEREELQHGEALKRYVQCAWPDFDWQTAYRAFLAEYRPLCTVDLLAATRALEMASRCVVETGTAAFYRMLSELSEEPVLRRLAAAISADEVRHYKHFYRYFLRYQEVERPSRAAVMRALWSRIAAVESEDAYCAFKAVYLARNPGSEFQRNLYDCYRADVVRLMQPRLPYAMAVKMLLKPLGLHVTVGRAMVPAVTSAARLFIGRLAARS
jgi:hypothetical protein